MLYNSSKSNNLFLQENYCNFLQFTEVKETNINVNHTYLLIPKTNKNIIFISDINSYIQLLDNYIIYGPLHNFSIDKDNINYF